MLVKLPPKEEVEEIVMNDEVSWGQSGPASWGLESGSISTFIVGDLRKSALSDTDSATFIEEFLPGLMNCRLQLQINLERLQLTNLHR